jgi:N-formylmethionyl-tRNA deformylase
MEKTIIRDVAFLHMPSAPATAADVGTAQDLLDTLTANRDRCVGLAANMIGVSKRIIAVNDEGSFFVMYNPTIVKFADAFEAEEGCLSLDGVRKTKRYKSIKVRYQNGGFQERTKTFKGWTAQIIQHEIDHCNGIII